MREEDTSLARSAQSGMPITDPDSGGAAASSTAVSYEVRLIGGAAAISDFLLTPSP